MNTPSRARALSRGTLGAAVLSTVVLSLAPAAAHSAAPAAPRLIAFAGGESAGVLVHSRADAKQLHGTGTAFKRFIGSLSERVVARSGCSDTSQVGVLVEFMRTDGYAVGAVADCGGHQALWAVVDGSWKQVQGTQDAWDCRVLRKHDVPSDVVGDTCYAYHGDQREHPYHQD